MPCLIFVVDAPRVVAIDVCEVGMAAARVWVKYFAVAFRYVAVLPEVRRQGDEELIGRAVDALAPAPAEAHVGHRRNNTYGCHIRPA